MSKKDQSLKETASVLKLLGDKTRLSIVSLLSEQECCVCEFVEIFNISQPAISQHLRKMRDLGIVKEQKKGQWVFYSLNNTSDYYEMIMELLKHIPNQREKIERLEEKGFRIICN
ncbi:ArsR/SmtB family transcription factor [Niallia sp. Sow4_A1]|jgi:ArsR family transcriptional regulator, arsenate/arsenite/antimonite-responsive transcriptional repressor|uniref:Metalloregulator ArsR/SmtB family transcription factor n=1 Tax=Niallia hominis TaxID=3133173 RepID=A0ABV1F292_9BACI|nr:MULTISPECIES: metalloregulator ArsR/SmtB family transcription factor [Bacillaceae]MCM3364522.1 metalloregulator ArsR/SmtB family transcription factor [Niallia sp. MER TA 168]CAI9394752.1 HTH-type transcriptional repressor AseR [Bacillus sp. T2.9-1]